MNDSARHLSIVLPDGRTATEQEMRTMSTMLQLFVQVTQERLPHIADSREHDDTIDALRWLARGFNEQLRLFRIAEHGRRLRHEATGAAVAGQWPAEQPTAPARVFH